MAQFVHLHCHTEYSLLDGAAKIEDLIQKASQSHMPAIAISDHGNMFGVPQFALAAKSKQIKPIIGCEFYICKYDLKNFSKENEIYHQILLARNEQGYKNLIYLNSIAYIEGYYYKPRIDKELLSKHSEGLIATTCCIASEINQNILKNNLEEAERLFLWYLNLFGEHYYVELQRHGLKDQDKCNQILLEWAKKYQVKVIATNDSHYVNQEDADAHDLLLALQTGSDYYDPNRFRFTDDNNQLNPRFYFKTAEEMLDIFQDVPEAVENTVAVAETVDFQLNLNADLLLPVYKVPPGFTSMMEYLRHLTWEGAKVRYPVLTPEITERIEHELRIIEKMGFEGYFLIVQGFTNEARKRNVLVGPGRGSAAGSVVAYCIGIIDIDPLQYSLLFERFLNPERISPPDIDIDFDDEGRQAVIDYVVEEYGRNSVCQIITFGTMGAKTALRDVGRTLKIPLDEVNRIAKLIPDKPGITFEKAFTKEENPDHYEKLIELQENGSEAIKKLFQYAKTLEGTLRHTGVHAAGVIIAPGELYHYIPLAVNKDKVVTTQYDGPHAEKVGLLKMDFLGLKTLSILKTCSKLIEQTQNIQIDPQKVPLDDPKTFELYQKGETVATFQFESDGMQKYLRQLKPTNIEDLIAMNALYRPGPMDNIPTFIDRKHGKQPIDYEHPKLEPILRNTYGIMVYQEQVMQIAQAIAGYSLGEADLLRRAMGKKKKEIMEAERSKFVERAIQQGVQKEIAEKIFDTMAKFAEYGFNKSHAAAYSVLAYQTAYLKAHFPHEYMAAVLSHHINDIKDITFFIEECRRMKIEVLPPCVNESELLFSVNKNKQIRFGLSAIKGLGEASAEAIIHERKKNGPYKDIYDFVIRLDPKVLNKKVFESLVYSGALDFDKNFSRSQYIEKDKENELSFMEKLMDFGLRYQQNQMKQASGLLFGVSTMQAIIEKPTPPSGKSWSFIYQLKQERNYLGFFLTGHPLDKYKYEIQAFTNCTIPELEHFKNKEVKLAGIVTDFQEKVSQKGTKWGKVIIEDFHASMELNLFGEEFLKFKHFLEIDSLLFIIGNYIPNYRNHEIYDLRVKEIKLLDELSQHFKEIVIVLDNFLIDNQLIKDLKQIFLGHQGKIPVKFAIRSEEGAELLTVSKNTFINLDNSLFMELQNLNLSFRLK